MQYKIFWNFSLLIIFLNHKNPFNFANASGYHITFCRWNKTFDKIYCECSHRHFYRAKLSKNKTGRNELANLPQHVFKFVNLEVKCDNASLSAFHFQLCSVNWMLLSPLNLHIKYLPRPLSYWVTYFLSHSQYANYL